MAVLRRPARPGRADRPHRAHAPAAARRRRDAPRRDGDPPEPAYAGTRVSPAAHRGGDARVADAAAVRRADRRAAGPRDRVASRRTWRSSPHEPADADRPRSARPGGFCAPRGPRGESPAAWATRVSNRLVARRPRLRSRSPREHLRARGEIAASGWTPAAAAPAAPGEPLTVAWVCAPAGAGSGGHTTMFRLRVRARAGWPHVHRLPRRPPRLVARAASARRSAWWPWVQAEVRDAAAGIDDAHAIVRDSLGDGVSACWPRRRRGTALLPRPGLRAVVLSGRQRGAAGRGDLPLRLPRRHRRALARGAAAHASTGWRPTTSTSAATSSTRSTVAGRRHERTGVCFYCAPETPRRAFELGVLALDLFAARHPEVDIHLFGRDVKAAAVRGDRPRPADARAAQRALQPLRRRARPVGDERLARARTRCWPPAASRSSTTPSTTGWCSTTPRSPTRRARRSSSPDALARSSSGRRPERRAAAEAAAASVQGTSWEDAGAAVERIVREVVDRAVDAAPDEVTRVSPRRPTSRSAPTVSVVDPVLPVRTLPARLRLAACWSRTGVDVRVLVIDDASPDDSGEVAARLAADTDASRSVSTSEPGPHRHVQRGPARMGRRRLLRADLGRRPADAWFARAGHRGPRAPPNVGFVYGHAVNWDDSDTARRPRASEPTGTTIWPGLDWLAARLPARTQRRHVAGGGRADRRCRRASAAIARPAAQRRRRDVDAVRGPFRRGLHKRCRPGVLPDPASQMTAERVALVDLEQRRDAFDAVFDGHGAEIRNAATPCGEPRSGSSRRRRCGAPAGPTTGGG